MDSRRTGLALIASAALVLAACSSSSSGGSGGTPSSGTATTSPSSAGGSTATPPSSSPAPGTSSATNRESLATLLQRGLASTRSAHISLLITTAGKSITGSGDERLASGKLTALSLTEVIPGAGRLQLIEVHGKTYAKLPGSLNTSGKPYVLVTTRSSNPTIKTLAASLASSQSSASIGNAGLFAEAASSIKDLGPATVGGTKTTHYAVVVASSKLPSDYPGKSALVQSGVRTFPVDLYVDGQGRPVQVTDKISVSGNTVASTFKVTDYNKPVTISAPPAAQVSTN